jgi:hypothetical protein
MQGQPGRRREPFFDEAAYRKYLRQLVASRRRIVYAVDFNVAGTHLAAGNSGGQLNIFDLKTAADMFSDFPVSDGNNPSRKRADSFDSSDRKCEDISPPPLHDRVDRQAGPTLSVHAGKGPIYSLFTNRALLFCGADHGILVYRWDDLIDDSPRVSARYSTSVTEGMSSESAETNAITGMAGGSHVYAATGLGSVDCFDATTFRYEGRFKGGGVGGYLHSIAMCGAQEDNSFITGGDDGIVRLYDQRAGMEPQRLFDMRKLSGAKKRAWVGCVATDTDGGFAVCGDGNRNLTSVHISSGCVLGSSRLDYVPNSLVYRNGELYCGGADTIGQAFSEEKPGNSLYRYDLECSEVGTSPVSSSGVYALSCQPETKSMAASGYSTRHRWYDAAELIDVYVEPPIQSFTMFASECMTVVPSES